jgi:hypothetical protein
VYGTDNGSPGNFHWCSNEKPFEPKEVKWAPGEPNSQFHCVYLKNMGGNKSVLATADCTTKKKFLCDVRKKETGGMAMQQECMEIWGITSSLKFILRLYFSYFSKYHVSGNIDFIQMAGVISANYTHDLKVYLFIMIN